MAGDETKALPTVLVALDKYDLMILDQVLAVAQEARLANFWSSDEAADIATVRARLRDAERELAEKHGDPPRAVLVGESPDAATRIPFDDE